MSEMSESENKSQPWGSSEVDPIQKSVSDKKDSVSNAVPLCLPNNYTWDSVKKEISVDKTKPRKTLTVCTEGLELLQSLKDQQVVVLCIAGPARSGKSFFASQLQEDVTFDVGHGAGSHTTGIWIGVGAKPIRVERDEARVVILDAEGLGGVTTDSSNTDAKWEHKIFSLCVLLSSYVIYNSKGPPNNDELDKLGFIAEFSRSIFRERHTDVEKQQTPSVRFGQFGPDFLWLFRDVLFKPDLNGIPCDWTEFVKKALLVCKPNEPERNNIRKSISSTFRTIRAADLPPPTLDSNAIKNLLSEKNKGKINQEFFPKIAMVVKSIFSSVQIKNIQGSKLTGQQVIDILSHVVDVINSECDELDVTSMWDSIVNAQMQRFIQSALDLYEEKMEQAELPEEEETYFKLHKSTKASSRAHFWEVATRFDKDIYSSQVEVLCDKIEIEFNNSLLKKNEQASLIFNNKLNTDLENDFFNNLPAKSSCMSLKNAEEKFCDCYNKRAKGPKAKQVKSETQLQRDQKIDIMRTESLIDAEQQSCELFEKSLKEALEGEPLTLSELNAMKETCINGCFNNFEKASCNDVDCNPCMKSKQSLSQRVESIFKKCSSECYDKSEKACQCLINDLIKRKLLPFVKAIDSHNYSGFRKIKDEILAQYEVEAKGPAKGDLLGTCTKTIDMQKEGIQLLIIQSALKSVYCEYTQILNFTAISDPYADDEELGKMLALKRRDMISAFKVRCEGIDKSTVEPYELNLEDLIKNFKTWIANENKRRSINICQSLVTRLSREFHDGILQTHIPEILRELEYSQCSDHLKRADNLKHKTLNDYKQKARGPEKERFQQTLIEYLEIHLIIIEEAVNEMILKTVLRQHFDQLDIVKLKYPISETELKTAISKTNENTDKEFTDSQKQISLPFVSCSKDILSSVLNFDTMQLVEENYKESMRQLDRICKDITLESRKKFEELNRVAADTFKFAQIRDDCTKEFENNGKGVLKDHYKSILQDNVDMELRFAHTTLADKRVKGIFADCRAAIVNLVQGNPYEQEDLERDIKMIEDNARKKIEKLQNKDAEANITGTKERLTIELKDTISYVAGKNLHISSEKCNAQLRKVMEALKSRCKTFLGNEKSTVEILYTIKTECLDEYEDGVIGPAKETVKKALEKEIDKEIQRTYVLFAKTNYRETLLVKTETFQYEDQVNSSREVNLDELTEHLEKESQDILLRYPGLIDKLKNDLSKDLREEREFYLKVLNQKITLTSQAANYRRSIEALIKDGPCEEEHLKTQIDKKRKEAWERIEKTFKEVKQTNFALTERMLKKALEDTTCKIKTQNNNLSTTNCNSCLLQVLKELKGYCKNFLESETSEFDNLRPMKAEYLLKYDKAAIGPAKAHVRIKMENEIVEEVERTLVLFAKANYRETLRVQTEAFQYEDQVNSSGEVNLDELTKHLEKESQDIILICHESIDKIKRDLSKDLREEREFYLKVLNQKIALTSEVVNYRRSLEALIIDGPCEEEHLKQQIDRIRKEAWERIETKFTEVEQKNFAITEGMLTKALEDTTRNIEKQNHILSTTYCNSHRLQVSEELKGYCRSYLVSETSVIGNLRHLKDEYLRKYDEVAIGPAKANERETLEPEIVGEVDRTFVLFAKAKYRIILREEIQTFQFLDLLNNPEPERIEQLIQLLMTKVHDILNTFPTLGRTTRNILTRDLEESINSSLLNEIITAYGEKITQLENRGILEEDELENEIESAKNGLFEILRPRILGNNGGLPKGSQNIIDNVETSFKQENVERSRISCQETFEFLFQCNEDYLTKEYFRKNYDEKCKGPARQLVWNHNLKLIDLYYDSIDAFWRKVSSPVKYIFHTSV